MLLCTTFNRRHMWFYSHSLLRLYWFPDHLIYLEIGLTSSHTICDYLGKLFEFAFAVISGGSLGCSSRAHTAQVPELLPLFLLYPVPFFLALNQCFTNNQTLALTLDLCSLEAKSWGRPSLGATAVRALESQAILHLHQERLVSTYWWLFFKSLLKLRVGWFSNWRPPPSLFKGKPKGGTYEHIHCWPNSHMFRGGKEVVHLC